MRSEQGTHGSKRHWLAACLWRIHLIIAFSDTLHFVNGGDFFANLRRIELGLVCDRILLEVFVATPLLVFKGVFAIASRERD